MKKLNYAGVGTVLSIIIIVVIAAAVAAGWVIWAGHEDGNPVDLTNSSNSAQGSIKKTDGAKADTAQPATTVTSISYDEAPASLKIAIKSAMGDCLDASGNITTSGPGTTSKLDDLKVSYQSNELAEATTCNAYSIFAAENGQWSYAFGGRGTPDCADLEKYNVPVALLTGGTTTTSVQCYNSEQKLIPYTNK